MNPLQKVAIFLFIIGFERASRIMELMDSNEIKMIVPKIQKLTEVSPKEQEFVRNEFIQLGYEEKMKSAEILSVIRLLFNGSKISDTDKRKAFR